ncbi:DEAD/DEAH box helicase [Psychrobium sp. 1_MG-2023]|uniref:DEAD/DEAH box helicase n=1 Tax=Psychrobium sp. 1_MG-2023 TaxID=3062624 RepID=UPI000C32D0DB|nr:DEAD/DEAH box helicase [Psychrobium sp. 1_MG-2023]MDP2561769.1 DEAD/DEAH box helicase [Psychrobium sp. 1_MG-2023]PKF59746.1 DEAD/DEAH box helicase [Alteromonadales bacterium alter-6D02]
MTSFASLPLSTSIVDALPTEFVTPTVIQQQAIPPIILGQDVIALAQTGTGKTLAYGLPVLDKIEPKNSAIQALIVVPTRELASQITAVLNAIAKPLAINVVKLCGGVAQVKQIASLSEHPQLVIATPGRLIDLLDQGELDLSTVNQLVFDEADRLLEMGFLPAIKTLLTYLPKKRQSLLFSATFPMALEDEAKTLLINPLKVEAQIANSVAGNINEQLYLVNKGSKAQALIALIKDNEASQVLVFAGARDNVNSLSKKIAKAGISVAALHGERQQHQREQSLNEFKHKAVRVLVATDVLARGIHIDALPLVINVDLPENAPIYVHRVGRTARAELSGRAISLVCHGEIKALKAIRQLTGRELPLLSLAGFPVTDKPASGESKRPPKDKKANRRTNQKRTIKQFRKGHTQ